MTRAASDHDIKILNSLIATTLASADGYSQAAAHSADATFRGLLEQWASERRQVVDDLQSQLRVLSGSGAIGNGPINGVSAIANELMFLKLRDLDDDSMLHEVERGEDFIRAMYEEALDDEDMSSEVRNAVVQAYSALRSAHDQARDLKYIRRRY